MSDIYESNTPPGTTQPGGPAETTGENAERVAFCQDCGKPLTEDAARRVGSSVFCEPCLTARAATHPPLTGQPAGVPHPVLAGLLSIIPGVGTIYNGQYAKGIAHLLIFVVLDALGKRGGVFGLIAFVWWCYQIIDAYQTAKARLEGRPLPNPFGLNEIGERMGFGKGWGQAAGTAGYTPSASAPGPAPTGAGAGPVATGTVGSAPDWVGYVPPTQFAGAPPPPQAQTSAAWGQVPYSQTYAGEPYAAPVYPAPVPVVTSPPSRFPVGAVWLIGLGVMFLVIELAQQWDWNFSLNFNWVLAALFAGLSAWTLTRRLRSGVPLACIVRWPGILGVLAILFALQALDRDYGLLRTWPVLFIAFGALLIVERTGLGENTTVSPASAAPFRVTPDADPAEAERVRTAWHTGTAPGKDSSSSDHDTTKGGL